MLDYIFDMTWYCVPYVPLGYQNNQTNMCKVTTLQISNLLCAVTTQLPKDNNKCIHARVTINLLYSITGTQ